MPKNVKDADKAVTKTVSLPKSVWAEVDAHPLGRSGLISLLIDRNDYGEEVLVPLARAAKRFFAWRERDGIKADDAAVELAAGVMKYVFGFVPDAAKKVYSDDPQMPPIPSNFAELRAQSLAQMEADIKRLEEEESHGNALRAPGKDQDKKPDNPGNAAGMRNLAARKKKSVEQTPPNK